MHLFSYIFSLSATEKKKSCTFISGRYNNHNKIYHFSHQTLFFRSFFPFVSFSILSYVATQIPLSLCVAMIQLFKTIKEISRSILFTVKHSCVNAWNLLAFVGNLAQVTFQFLYKFLIVILDEFFFSV